MDAGIIVNIILSILSFALAAISVVTVVITLRQNNKMLEANARPYVVAYLVYQEDPSHIYLCIKNFGSASAIVKSMKITPTFKLYQKTSDDIINNTMLAPTQQLHFFVMEDDKNQILHNGQYTFTVSLEYTDCTTKKQYSETYDINMEYATEVLSSRSSRTNYTPEQNALYNIERILTYTKNSNM